MKLTRNRTSSAARLPRPTPAFRPWRAAWVEQGAHDALPLACFHVLDGGIQVGLQLAQMTAQVPHHAIRRDRIPVGPLDLDDDQYLLIAAPLNGQVGAPPATPDKPPLTLHESRCPA